MLNIDLYLSALRLKWVNKIFTDDNNTVWKKIENPIFANYNYVAALVQSSKNLFKKNMLIEIPLRSVKVAYTALRQLAETCFRSSFSYHISL